MHVWWFITIIVYLVRPSYTQWWGTYEYPWIEQYYYPGFYTSTVDYYVNGTETRVPSREDTPDYRIEEPHFLLYKETYMYERERPIRNSPPYKQSKKIWNSKGRAAELAMGCYCCTTYRKYIVLATCAVITTRHILTTATPTVLILRSYAHLTNLEGILGAWYDTDANSYNASLYLSPSRIHIHPMYAYDYQVNVSHPIPAMYDLAVWAATYTFYGSLTTSVIICPRAASGLFEYVSSTPKPDDISIVAGFLFMKAYARRPMPWFRYIVKTTNHLFPCPKTDWHWFHCIYGEYWGKYGFDSGGGMHTSFLGKGWRRDGMAGMNAFSMKLRSRQTVHYFTVVDAYPVLDFLYDSFLGLKKSVFLDGRFQDTKWAAPLAWYGENIPHTYAWGEEIYYQTGHSPKYRR